MGLIDGLLGGLLDGDSSISSVPTSTITQSPAQTQNQNPTQTQNENQTNDDDNQNENGSGKKNKNKDITSTSTSSSTTAEVTSTDTSTTGEAPPATSKSQTNVSVPTSTNVGSISKSEVGQTDDAITSFTSTSTTSTSSSITISSTTSLTSASSTISTTTKTSTISTLPSSSIQGNGTVAQIKTQNDAVKTNGDIFDPKNKLFPLGIVVAIVAGLFFIIITTMLLIRVLGFTKRRRLRHRAISFVSPDPKFDPGEEKFETITTNLGRDMERGFDPIASTTNLTRAPSWGSEGGGSNGSRSELGRVNEQTGMRFQQSGMRYDEQSRMEYGGRPGIKYDGQGMRYDTERERGFGQIEGFQRGYIDPSYAPDIGGGGERNMEAYDATFFPPQQYVNGNGNGNGDNLGVTEEEMEMGSPVPSFLTGRMGQPGQVGQAGKAGQVGKEGQMEYVQSDQSKRVPSQRDQIGMGVGKGYVQSDKFSQADMRGFRQEQQTKYLPQSRPLPNFSNQQTQQLESTRGIASNGRVVEERIDGSTRVSGGGMDGSQGSKVIGRNPSSSGRILVDTKLSRKDSNSSFVSRSTSSSGSTEFKGESRRYMASRTERGNGFA
ncbi:hypothetical protein TREMEDRAFT_64152 [Tremella mesenterica DSM 1558]|uniref:uncharacterized protein n=1 Tax=Tremella mesenterica (strain ATCC 24925 / CBS 8224 / DSM 1558 / NBRC 9311 / NRRL Y-6157 / RJB 2259-6 / UBC 559-6) TaxID=578456 RepID=UPI0003F49543|nr:uncharacterized protein TREMEDRAFT_64152 [Tremella mesenterica DSM 1558]EIW67564.1 hypothetical protein TREMEDRAFT_64152 [Tremella mesenterica DSM 1558]